MSIEGIDHDPFRLVGIGQLIDALAPCGTQELRLRIFGNETNDGFLYQTIRNDANVRHDRSPR